MSLGYFQAARNYQHFCRLDGLFPIILITGLSPLTEFTPEVHSAPYSPVEKISTNSFVIGLHRDLFCPFGNDRDTSLVSRSRGLTISNFIVFNRNAV